MFTAENTEKEEDQLVMSEVVLTEQLDQAIEAMFRNPDAPLPSIDSAVADLFSLAVELRVIPRPDFRARLKN